MGKPGWGKLKAGGGRWPQFEKGLEAYKSQMLKSDWWWDVGPESITTIRREKRIAKKTALKLIEVKFMAEWKKANRTIKPKLRKTEKPKLKDQNKNQAKIEKQKPQKDDLKVKTSKAQSEDMEKEKHLNQQDKKKEEVMTEVKTGKTPAKDNFEADKKDKATSSDASKPVEIVSSMNKDKKDIKEKTKTMETKIKTPKNELPKETTKQASEEKSHPTLPLAEQSAKFTAPAQKKTETKKDTLPTEEKSKLKEQTEQENKQEQPKEKQQKKTQKQTKQDCVAKQNIVDQVLPQTTPVKLQQDTAKKELPIGSPDIVHVQKKDETLKKDENKAEIMPPKGKVEKEKTKDKALKKHQGPKDPTVKDTVMVAEASNESTIEQKPKSQPEEIKKAPIKTPETQKPESQIQPSEKLQKSPEDFQAKTLDLPSQTYPDDPEKSIKKKEDINNELKPQVVQTILPKPMEQKLPNTKTAVDANKHKEKVTANIPKKPTEANAAESKKKTIDKKTTMEATATGVPSLPKTVEQKPLTEAVQQTKDTEKDAKKCAVQLDSTDQPAVKDVHLKKTEHTKESMIKAEATPAGTILQQDLKPEKSTQQIAEKTDTIQPTTVSVPTATEAKTMEMSKQIHTKTGNDDNKQTTGSAPSPAQKIEQKKNKIEDISSTSPTISTELKKSALDKKGLAVPKAKARNKSGEQARVKQQGPPKQEIKPKDAKTDELMKKTEKEDMKEVTNKADSKIEIKEKQSESLKNEKEAEKIPKTQMVMEEAKPAAIAPMQEYKEKAVEVQQKTSAEQNETQKTIPQPIDSLIFGDKTVDAKRNIQIKNEITQTEISNLNIPITTNPEIQEMKKEEKQVEKSIVKITEKVDVKTKIDEKEQEILSEKKNEKEVEVTPKQQTTTKITQKSSEPIQENKEKQEKATDVQQKKNEPPIKSKNLEETAAAVKENIQIKQDIINKTGISNLNIQQSPINKEQEVQQKNEVDSKKQETVSKDIDIVNLQTSETKVELPKTEKPKETTVAPLSAEQAPKSPKSAAQQKTLLPQPKEQKGKCKQETKKVAAEKGNVGQINIPDRKQLDKSPRRQRKPSKRESESEKESTEQKPVIIGTEEPASTSILLPQGDQANNFEKSIQSEIDTQKAVDKSQNFTMMDSKLLIQGVPQPTSPFKPTEAPIDKRPISISDNTTFSGKPASPRSSFSQGAPLFPMPGNQNMQSFTPPGMNTQRMQSMPPNMSPPTMQPMPPNMNPPTMQPMPPNMSPPTMQPLGSSPTSQIPMPRHGTPPHMSMGGQQPHSMHGFTGKLFTNKDRRKQQPMPGNMPQGVINPPQSMGDPTQSDPFGPPPTRPVFAQQSQGMRPMQMGYGLRGPQQQYGQGQGLPPYFTNPFSNQNTPRMQSFMPEYRQPAQQMPSNVFLPQTNEDDDMDIPDLLDNLM